MPYWRTVHQISKRIDCSLHEINSIFVSNAPASSIKDYSILLSSKPVFRPLKLLFLISPNERKDVKKEQIFQFILYQLNKIVQRTDFFIYKFSQCIPEENQKHIFEELILTSNIEYVAAKNLLSPTQLYQIVKPIFDRLLISAQDFKKFKISIVFIEESFTEKFKSGYLYLFCRQTQTYGKDHYSGERIQEKIRFI